MKLLKKVIHHPAYGKETGCHSTCNNPRPAWDEYIYEEIRDENTTDSSVGSPDRVAAPGSGETDQERVG